ncbi:GntR family transcriptional regulator [Labrys wisconsinensis]|uniref:DNA-binding GntR family transcriptional regulator n=1 Tax=Labrys wisconsinensis TaxID=425677 RepID=A0ABU0J8J9_9HYPH|nr:GntR family transcriptional regulator [Labrys wisconsinensis]MDQ0470605.1 DNA-binding GntR family transcriptional regulator [Labrys wisconsinensis]
MQTDQILSAIEEDIVFGVLPPQSRLVEERLAERFEAKRHTIREVFAILEDLGLVVRVPNKGAVVTELTPAEVRDIYDVREILETSAALRTRLPAPAAVIEAMTGIQERHAAAVANEDFRSVFHLNIDFHREQYSACANRQLVQTIADYARKAHLIRAIKYGDRAHMAKVVAQHWAIIDAMKGSDHDRLVQLIRDHLPGSPEEYIRSYEIRYGRHPREMHAAGA